MMNQTNYQADDEIVVHYESTPGTEILYDNKGGNGATSNRLGHLQHLQHGDSHILLVPQPSLTDPNDPLRWSAWKKWGVLFSACWYSFNGSVTGPIMAAGMIPLAETFGETLQRLTYANGATLICQGVANTIWLPFAVKYGRRPVYLASNLLMGVGCVWLAVASDKTYTPFIIGRAFLGAFEAPIESIVPSTITDIFFLHDRGEKVSIYGLSVLGGNELGPMLSAFIIQSLGMAWAFWIVATWILASLVTMFFFMPETKYTGPRPKIVARHLEDEHHDKPTSSTELEVLQNETIGLESDATIQNQHALMKRSYIQELKPWGMNDESVSLRKTFLRPFVLLAFPTVLWSCLIYGFALAWNVILGASVAQLFAPPPYGFNSSAQGLIFISPLIGSLIGTYLCGPLADMIANFYTKRNNGIREAEMRLPTCAIACLFTFFGALVSGLTYHFKTHWAGPIVGFGILTVGGQMGATLAMSYSLDCHRELSVELMVTVASLKSALAWIFTWVINDWISADGFLTTIMIIATLNVVAYLSTFALYYKGKSIRLWLNRTNLLAKVGLD